MSVQQINGKFPHVHWLDLDGNGTVVECAVLKRDHFNNIYYIQIDKLDSIDKQRLIKILKTRNIENMELWDAMSSVTLGNGVNALSYFHQIARVITDNGDIMRPRLGKQGVVFVNDKPEVPTVEEIAEAMQPTAPKKRGRPKKS